MDEGGATLTMKRKTTVTERRTDSSSSIVTGILEIIQDLLVPELKAIQVTLQHLQEELKEHRRQTEERFAKVWQMLNRLLEANQHTKLIFQRILDRLDVTEMVKETQSRQKMVEAEVAYLRELMTLLLH